LLDDPLEQAAFTTRRTSSQGEVEAVSQFRISGMYCAACAGQIEDALRLTPGVIAARVQAASERAEVVWAPELTRPSALIAAIEAAGYGAVPDGAASDRAVRTAESRAALWRMFVAGFCMMQVMMYAAPAYLATPILARRASRSAMVALGSFAWAVPSKPKIRVEAVSNEENFMSIP
jgi:Cu2+-exporting ATPase